MEVSIVIRTKNEAIFIGETLERIRSQEFAGEYEVIIVDSGSTDGTLEIAKGYDLKLVEIPQEHFTYGRSLNLGIRQAESEIVVNLSAHAWPLDEGWLRNLTTDLALNNVAAVYGRQVSSGKINPFEAQQSELFFGDERVIFDLKRRKSFRNIHFSNSNCAIRKDVWQRFPFNEQVPYGEDMVWQRQVSEAGYSVVYAPNAVVFHTHKLSLFSAFKNSRDCAYSLAMMDQKQQSAPLIVYDFAIFVTLMGKALFENFWYMWERRHLRLMTMVPVYVLSTQLGWLIGRTKHRLKK